MLKDYLKKNNILLKFHAKSWEEAVEAAGQLLVNSGGVTPGYIQAMLETVQELGPYIVLAPGIAMPHARPDAGVKNICLSLVTLAEPVEFGNKKFDPVSLVFAFGAVDNNSHLDLLSSLSKLLSDEKSVESLKSASTLEEVYKIFGGV